VKDADRVVERSLVHRQAREGAARQRGRERVERRVDVHGGHPLAGHHQVGRRQPAEPECAVQPAFLVGLEQAAVAALDEQQLDLLGRVHVVMAGVAHAGQAQQEQAGAVEERDEPGERLERELHRHHRQEGGAGRVLERDGLGRELGHDHLDGREAHQDDGRGDRFGPEAGERLRPREQRLERRRNLRLGVRAEREAAERDAHLAGRDVAVEQVRVVHHRQQQARQPAAALRQPADPVSPRAHHAELAGDVEGVDEDQEDNDGPDEGRHGQGNGTSMTSE